MTKFTKLSLIATLALAGTTACAQPLAEAIKNVEVSGTVVYRYNDYDNGTKKSDNSSTGHKSNNYQVAVNVSSKVNDDLTANTRFRMGDASLDTRNTGDANLDAELSEANFTYTGVKGLSLTVGKQAIATPWTVARDSLGNESTGTGAVAAYTAGPVTLVGAYFNQTNLGDTIDGEVGLEKIERPAGTLLFADTNASGSNSDEVKAVKDALGAEDIYVLGAMATFAGVTVDAFYADLDDQFDSYTVGLESSYNVGAVKLSPFARYTSLSPDKDGAVATVLDTDDDQELWQVGLGASMGMFNAFVAYGEAGSDGGFVFLDSGSKVNMDYHWRVTADGSADTEYLYAHVDADVTEKVNVGLFYSDADYKEDDSDVNEIYVQAKYQMSSNLFTYVRLGQLDSDSNEDDQDMGRVHVQYSF